MLFIQGMKTNTNTAAILELHAILDAAILKEVTGADRTAHLTVARLTDYVAQHYQCRLAFSAAGWRYLRRQAQSKAVASACARLTRQGKLEDSTGNGKRGPARCFSAPVGH